MENSLRKYFVNIFAFVLCIIFIDGCIVVKYDDSGDVAPPLVLSPKPEIEMSEELVRSKMGDMIAFLPKDWFFVEVDDKSSSDIFAVAMNPDYTLCAVFSIIKSNDETKAVFQKEGLLGLARLNLSLRQNKTSGNVKLSGKYQQLSLGPFSFVEYEFSPSSGINSAKSAVFQSSINQFYQFSLVPMEFTGRPVPSKEEIDIIFRSILATIQY